MIDVLQRLREIADRSPEEIGRAIAAAEKMTASVAVTEEMTEKQKKYFGGGKKDDDKDEKKTDTKGAKPDFADIDKDGDKEESMKKAAKDKEKVDEADSYSIKNTETDNTYHISKYPITSDHSIYKKIKAKDPKEVAQVDEDVQITLTGSDAVLAEILKLAGQIGAKTSGNPTPIVAPMDAPKPMGVPPTGPLPNLDTMMGDVMGMEDEVMNDSYSATTTPDPVTMDMDAAIPSGDDLSKSKLTAPRVAPGDNPLQTARSF